MTAPSGHPTVLHTVESGSNPGGGNYTKITMQQNYRKKIMQYNLFIVYNSIFYTSSLGSVVATTVLHAVDSGSNLGGGTKK